jgi:hypothetical protein
MAKDMDPIAVVGAELDKSRIDFISALSRLDKLPLPIEKKENIYNDLRTNYQQEVRNTQQKDPENFQIWADSQEKRYTDVLNKLAFESSEDLPYDEELGNELQYMLTMPFGSEAEEGLDKNENLQGFATPQLEDQKEIFVSMGADDPVNVARHEGWHELTGGEPVYITDSTGEQQGYGTEYVARAFDYLRGIVDEDPELVASTEKFVNRGSRNTVGGYTLLKIAIESLPQLYKQGVFDKDKATLETAQKIVKQIDKDEQGFIDSILGKEPEKVEEPLVTRSDPLYLLSGLKKGDKKALQDLKDIISVLPFSEKEQEDDVYTDSYRVTDREGLGLAQGGAVDTPYDYKEFGISAPEYLATKLLGVDEDVVDAAGFARSYGEEKQLLDDDRTEDTLRHILLGGLVRGEDEEMTFRRGLATKYIDAREVDENRQPLNEESSIDQINNIYGLKLREKFKSRDEFIAAAKNIAEAVSRGEDVPELDGYTPKLSYGSTGEGFAQGGAVDTPAGEEMKKDNPNPPIPQSADLNNDGEIDQMEKMKYQAAKAVEPAEMNCGGMMADPFAPMNVIVGMDGVSGNEIPAGSMAHEVRDDVPAMLSEGEYVVPADVVRWHGLKTFEALRGEAKMAMGLMAEHGRMSYPEEEEYEEEDYEEDEYEDSDDGIEEEDVDVEEAEFKVIHAAEGTSVESTPAPTFYRYVSRLNPVTRRYEFVAIDPATGQQVAPEDFDPARSTRYTKGNLLESIYGKAPAEAEEEETAEEAVVRKAEFRDSDGDGGNGGGESVPRTIENDFGFQKPNTVIAGLFGLINPILGAAVRGAQNLNNANAVSAARKYLGMKPLSFGDQLKGAITGDYNKFAFDYSISFDDETDALNAMGFIDSKDAAGVSRADVRNELVSRGLDPSSPTLGLSKEDLALGSSAGMSMSAEDKKKEEDRLKGGGKVNVINIGVPSSMPSSGVEVVDLSSDKDGNIGSGGAKSAGRGSAPTAADYSAMRDPSNYSPSDQQTADRSGWAGSDYDGDGQDGGGDVAGFDDPSNDSYGELAKGGYIARKNTPKKVLIKR